MTETQKQSSHDAHSTLPHFSQTLLGTQLGSLPFKEENTHMNIKPLSMQRQKNIAHYEGLVLVDEPAEANYVSMKYQQSDSERSEVIIAVKCQFVI